MERLYIIIQTIFVYMVVLMALYNGGKRTAKTFRFKYVVYAILFYSIIFGLRYGVGTDTNSYIKDYEYAVRGMQNGTYETGFAWFENLFASNALPCSLYLGTIALLQLFLVYFALRKNKYVFPYIAITFMLGCVWLSYANGIRQEIAFSIYFLAMSYMDKKHFYLYFILVFLATLFHKSAFILFLTFPLLLINKDLFPSKKVQYVLFVLAIIAGNLNIVSEMMDRLETFATMFGYENYFEDRYLEKFIKKDSGNGVGYYVLLLLPVITIYYSDILKKHIPSISKIYNLYFIGVILKYAFINSPLIQRVNYYFYGFEFIVMAYLLYVLHENNRKVYRFFVLVLSIAFIGTLYRMFDNDSAFYFIGQEELHKQLTHKTF